jgi:MOSC domain-containing protein YiiM
VTLLGAEAWERVEAALGRPVDPSARRANLMVGGLDLSDSRGRILHVGVCRILVHGETRPCRRMDKALPGLEAALVAEWRGGIYGEVLTGGDIELGDAVAWEPEADAPADPPTQ